MGTGQELVTWAQAIGGSFFIVIAIVIALVLFARRDWGMLVTFIVVAVIVSGFIFLPTQTIAALQWLWNAAFGGGSASAPAPDPGVAQ